MDWEYKTKTVSSNLYAKHIVPLSSGSLHSENAALV